MRLLARPIDTWPGASTPEARRTVSPFTATWASTLVLLEREVTKLAGAGATVVLQLAIAERDCRLDGGVRADARPTHPGVIVAFETKKHGPLRYSTDIYQTASWGHNRRPPLLPGWQANVRAVALGLEALRKVDRYGIARGGEQYRGWKALPAAGGGEPVAVLASVVGISREAASGVVSGTESARSLYRSALKAAHPDHGGSRDLLEQVQDAGRKLGVA